MADAYELPDIKKPDDEVESKESVEIVDDTPEADRGREAMPKDIVEDLDKDDLSAYSDKVKQRLSQLKKVWHDERREKERSFREREEALRFAQRAIEENKHLKQRLNAGERVFIEESTKAAKTMIDTARDKLLRAYESGDAKTIAEAQEMLTDAKLRHQKVSDFRPTPLQNDNFDVQPPQQPQVPPAATPSDPKAENWRNSNTWFGTDEEMTGAALGLHEKLVRSGVNPTSDEYYRRIDETMKKRFPDYFGESQTADDEAPAKAAPRRQNSTVVAPAARSTAPRQIRITASEAAIAKRLGLTPEAYAREKAKLEN